MAADLLFFRLLPVIVGRLWSPFDGPVTAHTSQGRPKKAPSAVSPAELDCFVPKEPPAVGELCQQQG
ncbi:hypothetical protein AB0K35_22360 [Micromonospora sp. NPDC053740]|uniref:hypothetical protein n=1 Tax=Micromonospora sp. NPDC053740 TaxID=3155173 RepID=UPI00343ED462